MRKPSIKLSEFYSGRYSSKFSTTLNKRGTPFSSKIIKVAMGKKIF
jgi:hypothetical protein